MPQTGGDFPKVAECREDGRQAICYRYGPPSAPWWICAVHLAAAVKFPPPPPPQPA